MMFGAAAPTLVTLLGDDPEMSADEKIDRYLMLKDIDSDLRSLSPADRASIGQALLGDDYLGDYADLVQKIGGFGKKAIQAIGKAVKKKKAAKKAAKKSAAAKKIAAAASGIVQSVKGMTKKPAAPAPVVAAVGPKPPAVWILPAAVGVAAVAGALMMMRKRGR